MESIVHILQALSLYLLWGKINTPLWWVLLIAFFLMYFGSKTYHTALVDGSEGHIVELWRRARIWIFITDVASLLVIFVYLLIK